jgi:predicted RNase H-like nuclease
VTGPDEPSDVAELADRLVARAGDVRDRLGSGADPRAALAQVAEALAALRTGLGPSPATAGGASVATPEGPVPLPPLEVTVPVLGVDACAAGWVGAILEPGAPRPRVAVASTIAGLVESVRRSLGIQVVGIDIPIGLPDRSTRQADTLARKALPGKASSVFTTLTRAAYAEDTRAAADSVNRALTGQGVGAQAFALRAKILEVDTWVRSRPTVTVVEVHPELSFAVMAGAPLLPGKKTDEGRRDRLAALATAGLLSPSVLAGPGYAADDVLDACAAAWTAARVAAGEAWSLPDPPQTWSDGIPAAIWA